MFAEQYSVEGRLSLLDSEFLYIQKTIYFFETLVREEASNQRIPNEILRVLKACRACIVMSADAFFCVVAYYGADDPWTRVVHTDDVRPRSLDIADAERIGIKRVIRDIAADPLTLRFPLQSLHMGDQDKRAVLAPIVQSYLAFEVSWAKQRGLLTVPKPFFPGQHFTIDHGLIFVLMPFAHDFNDIYSICIKPTIERHVPRCLRADEIFHNQPIVEVIWKHINEAGLIVADLTSRNPNVFYEVGMAHTLGKEVILLAQELNDVPFDLRHLNVIKYQWTPPGAEKLKASLDATITALLKRERLPMR